MNSPITCFTALIDIAEDEQVRGSSLGGEGGREEGTEGGKKIFCSP